MAIIPSTKYPGKTAGTSASYPQGQARNITVPSDGTGTPWDEGIVNDNFGLQQAILLESATTPSGVADTALVSQYLEGLRKVLSMRTVTYNFASDADYSLTSDQNKFGRILLTDTGPVLTLPRVVTLDVRAREVVVKNSTAQNLTIIALGGSGVVINPGQELRLYNNGTDIIVLQSNKTGRKNLLINGRGLIQQRGLTGGRIQVVLNTDNAGGSHTISWVGTATVTIKEAAVIAASDGTTTWDAPLVTGGTTGATVTLTAGKYIHVEFSTTAWDYAQLEEGLIATNYETLEHDDRHLKFYERIYDTLPAVIACASNVSRFGAVPLRARKISLPLLSYSALIDFNQYVGVAVQLGATTVTISTNSVDAPEINITTGSAIGTGGDAMYVRLINSGWIAFNSEIFNADDGVNIQYCQDRWYKNLP